MPVKLVFDLHMLSDYHTASGMGFGKSLDATLVRDRDGSLLLRGSTLAGLMRSAAKELSSLLPEGQASAIIERIFGSERCGGAWSFSTARVTVRPLTARSLNHNKRWAQVRHGVRIDPIKRRAEDKKLYAREFGSAGLHFTFNVECLATNGALRDEAALLVGAARLVRALGSGINRGAGRCLISLTGIEGVSDGLDQGRLLEHLALMVRQRPRQTTLTIVEPSRPSTVSDATYLRVTAEALEPLVISQGSLGGNEYESLPYIPGTVLLGALAARYLQRYPLPHDPDRYARFIRLFRRGGASFGPLYPCLELSRSNQLLPTIPTPQDMLTCKHHPFYSAHGHEMELTGYACSPELPTCCPVCAPDQEVPMVSTDGFLAIERDIQRSHRHLKPRREFQPHVAMRPDDRRANGGELFSYQALSAGQYFFGEIHLADRQALDELLSLTDSKADGSYEIELFLGKRFTRGYGRCRVVIQPANEAQINPFPLTDRVKRGQPITMTLLSDTILHDPWGRTRSDLSEEVLSDLLGYPVRIRQVFSSAREVEGFYAAAGLPKDRDLAIKAGSVVGFTVSDTVDWQQLTARLQQLERDGIGLRRHEGFGRVAFNHAAYASDGSVRVTKPTRALSRQDDPWSVVTAVTREIKLPVMSAKMAGQARNLARWLDAQHQVSAQELVTKIHQLGELKPLSQIEPRSKENMFDEGGFRDGLAKLVAQLNESFEDELRSPVRRLPITDDLRAKLWHAIIEKLADMLVEQGGAAHD